MEYKPPILTILFRLIGIFCLIAAVVIGVIVLRAGAELKASGVETNDVARALSVFGGGILACLLYFGIAQAIDFLGRTAFFTEQMFRRPAVRSVARTLPAAAPGHDNADAADAPTMVADDPAPERTKFACAACGQRISAMTSQIGTVITCPNCGEDALVS